MATPAASSSGSLNGAGQHLLLHAMGLFHIQDEQADWLSQGGIQGSVEEGWEAYLPITF